MPSRLAARATGAARLRRGATAVARVRDRAPLRVRLVAVLLLLVALALTGSGVAAATTLRSYLLDRVDSQLADTQRSVLDHGLSAVIQTPDGHGADPDGNGAGGPNGDVGQRLPSAYVVEVTGPTGGVVYGPTSALGGAGTGLPALPHTAAVTTAHTLTVGAVSGGGQWRVLAQPVTLADGTRGTLYIAQSLGDVRSTVNRLVGLLLLVGAAAIVVLGALGYLIVRRSLRPLHDVELTAARIAAGDLSRRVPVTADPRTEVGGLSAAINTMLGQIETAFAERARSEQAARTSEERMRRFVTDASHELRTPLTTIRGFAELYRQGAAGEADAVPRLMRRIEDEAARMGLLVQDLLTLARLDQQRPLAQLPVDVLALARDTVSDARAVDPGRPISLQVAATDPPPVVTGDDARLRQVLSNLVTNALQHTPAGTPVTVRVGTTSHTGTAPLVRVSVEDSGAGMTPADADRVFERFYRADSSRDRRDGGSGLGLSIVSALVAAHGGRVGVDTAPGAGGRFWIELPLDGADGSDGADRADGADGTCGGAVPGPADAPALTATSQLPGRDGPS